jgi:hypothetical protein
MTALGWNTQDLPPAAKALGWSLQARNARLLLTCIAFCVLEMRVRASFPSRIRASGPPGPGTTESPWRTESLSDLGVCLLRARHQS